MKPSCAEYFRIRQFLDAKPIQLVGGRKKHTGSRLAPAADSGRRDLEIYDGPIVISGIAGRFPKSDNMKALKENLLAGLDLMSENTRWPPETLPDKIGVLDSLDKWDNGFFSTVPRQADCIDPQIRLLIEVAFESLIDAGMNPTEMRGTRTGLFCGSVGGEATDYSIFNINRDVDGYFALSSSNFVLPGRISFALDLRGPAFLLSGACASSLMAVEAAVNCITLGQCDAAIVTGSNVLLNPLPFGDMLTIGGVSADGHCKAFDDSADGFARSEAAIAILIQKKADARRHYVTVRNVLTSSDGFKHEGVFAPSGEAQGKLMREVYKKGKIDPGRVSFMEAHGTGTRIGDLQELPQIHDVFCNVETRKKPLLLGSVKSNLGHTESAAGLASLAKAIIAIQTGTIPPNLHFHTPRKELGKYFGDKLKVVTEPTPYDGGLIAISSYGIVGTNAHAVLEPGPITSEAPPVSELPVIVPLAGRSEDQVAESLREALEHAHNPEYAYLLQRAYHREIPGYPWRGFGMLKPGHSEPSITVESCSTGGDRPVWVIFPGMGSQWNEMGTDLMKIQPFSESLRKSKETMKNLGLDLDAMLAPNNKTIFDDIHHAVMVITAMQIALYDTLKALEIKPDGFLGHSTGEFLCAYADDCLSAEETILVTDARGRAFKKAQKVKGAMASVGLSWDQVQARLAPDVQLACNNAANNVTVSGVAESVAKFVEELKAEGKFAVVVNSCGVAAHSVHVQDAADMLREEIRQMLKGEERVRSSKWISTSIREENWGSELARCASPEYFDNNLRAPVLFYQGLQHVPAGSAVIEVSPKGFFQAILKETVPSDCVHFAPMTIKCENKLDYFFESVGKMYLAGLDMRIDQIYPAVRTPVSANLPCISPLVKWDHERSWNKLVMAYPMVSASKIDVDLENPLHSDLIGHKLEDRIVFPATGYMVHAWVGFMAMLAKKWMETPIQMSNVTLNRATLLNEKQVAHLKNRILPGLGKFEFENEGDIVVSGNISLFNGKAPSVQDVEGAIKSESSQYLPLGMDDIYKEFRLRGYNYTGLFKGIHKIDNEGKWAEVNWTGDWISFLDTILQTSILCTTSRHLALPTEFEKITIDPVEFLKSLKEPQDGNKYPTVRVAILPNQQKVICPGIEFKGLNVTIVPAKRQRGNLAYEKYDFCPFVQTSSLDMEPHLWELIDLVLSNTVGQSLKVTDVFTKKENTLAAMYQHILTLKPLRESDVTMLTVESEAEKMDESEKKVATLTTKPTTDKLVPDGAPDLAFLDEPSLLAPVAQALKPRGFLLLQSDTAVEVAIPGLSLVSQKTLPNKTLSLFRKADTESHSIVQVAVDTEGFAWVSELQETLKLPVEKASRIYVTSQGSNASGILGLVNCLIQEEGGDRIRCIFDPEKKLTLDFNSPDSMLQSIIDNGLAVNVFKNGQLGSYRHVPLEAETNGVVKSTEHAYISTLTPGDLTSLRWIESPVSMFKASESADQKLYNVAYAAMNFRDVLLATTTIPIDPDFSYRGPYLGFEFSGFDEKGSRVMGITKGKGLASSVISDPRFVWPVPDSWTLEQAATVPVVYATVLYAFHVRGNLKAGQTVLIHAGTGGVGQAAISIALHHGCHVLTTVGTPEKRELIKKLYPQIKDEHIGNSRDTSFEAQFMELTNGRGVDVVLNSLADDKLMASVRCLALNGKFLEIGVYDAFKNTPLGMRPFLKNIAFHGTELYHAMEDTMEGDSSLSSMLMRGIDTGAVRPLPTHVFESDQLEEAFRFMAAGKHMGKLLIKVRDEQKPPTETINLPAIGRSYFPSDRSYIVVGGLGGLGMEVANWMVDRGARHLILTSRSGVTTGYQSLCLRKWKQLGVTVETPQIDLADREKAEKFISEVASKHNIGGIFNSALVLRDELFPNQTVEAFEEVCAPKATVTGNLDELTRKHCPNLEYFVCFSSSACGRGNSDQTNYGWANSVMERICESRMADGLHGLAIQWGVLGQVGVVAEKLFKDMDDNAELLGTLPQTVDSCLEVLDAALQQRVALASSIVVAEKGKKKGDKGGLLSRMSKIFGIKDLDTISPDKKLTELGMDSLIGVELKQTLERDYDIPVTKDVLLSLTIGDLKAIDFGTYTGAAKGMKRSTEADDITPFRIHNTVVLPFKTDLDSESCKTIFFAHGLEGSIKLVEPLAQALNANSYGFQFTGFRKDNVSMSVLAERYIKELQAVQPQGPYILAGYSGGGLIVYEMALQLQDIHNEPVEKIIFLDGTPCFEGTAVVSTPILMQLAESKNLFDGAGDEIKKKFEDSLGGNVKENGAAFLDLLTQAGGVEAGTEEVIQYLNLVEALSTYRPSRTYDGPTVAVKTTDPAFEVSLLINQSWPTHEQYCVGPRSLHQVSGDHHSFLDQEHVQETVEILRKILPPPSNDTAQE